MLAENERAALKKQVVEDFVGRHLLDGELNLLRTMRRALQGLRDNFQPEWWKFFETNDEPLYSTIA